MTTATKLVRASFYALAAPLIGACASEAPASSEDAEVATPASAIGTLRGTITYAGAQTGVKVAVAVFREFPPTAPPAAAQASGYPATGFPIAYELAVPAGTYKAMAFIDVTGDSYSPTEGDPISPTYDVTVPAGGTASADIVIE